MYLSNSGKVTSDNTVLRSFSSCYGHDSRQEDIFEADVRPLVDVVYSGAVCPSNALPYLRF